MTYLPYLAAGWILIAGVYGLVTSGHVVRVVVSLSVAQSGTYVLLLAIGYRRGATAPVFSSSKPVGPVVDPVVQAMTLTDIVVNATVTALLLAIAVQVAKRRGTVDTDELRSLE